MSNELECLKSLVKAARLVLKDDENNRNINLLILAECVKNYEENYEEKSQSREVYETLLNGSRQDPDEDTYSGYCVSKYR